MRKNKKSTNLNIAIIDGLPFINWYSTYLAEELAKLINKKGFLYFYGPKDKKLDKNVSYIYRNLWSPSLWPLQIIRQSIRDKINIIHIQFEFKTFGNLYSSLLLAPFLFLSKLLNLKIVTTIHGPIFPKNNSRKNLINLIPQNVKIPLIIVKTYIIFTYIIISKLSSAIIVHGKTFKKILETYRIKKVYHIPHGIEKSENLNNKLNKLIKIKMNQKIILSFGVISPRKGLEYLIQAFSELLKEKNNIILVIAGGESSSHKGYINKLIHIVKNHNIENNVVFTGYLSESQVNDVFNQADIVVLFYPVSRSASGSLSLAMAYGKPIIATYTEYFSEVLTNNVDALLVPPKDLDFLIKNLNTLINNEKLRKKLSKNIKLKAKKNSWEKVAQNTKNLYQKLLHSKLK